jgi:nitrogen regulation protein NR(I)
MSSARILLVEDDPALANGLQRVLAAEDYEIIIEPRGDRGLALAQEQPFDAVVTDLKVPGLNGLEIVRQLHAARPRLPIILMTAHGTTEIAIEATKLGAYDYLLKPFEMEELLALTTKAVASARLMSEPVELGDSGSAREALIGNSRQMQELYKEIGRVAAKPVTVLIRGETGTGKELVARALYQHSDRAKAPFVAVNCAAIPDTLLESELFGHERGAFTGAEARRIGRFEQAHGGTLFLDEIGDLNPSTQAKLLRVLQERHLQRLGGKEIVEVDVRVIAATHRDLEAAIQERLFREDLFFRLSVVVIRVPPLRERTEDIPPLVSYFLRRYGAEFKVETTGITPEAVQFLQSLPWPGNVRELENVVRRAMLLARGYAVSLDHLQEVLRRHEPVAAPHTQPLASWLTGMVAAAKRGEADDLHARTIEAVERELLSQALEQAAGNQSLAARWLGISRLTLREKLTRFGLRPGDPA